MRTRRGADLDDIGAVQSEPQQSGATRKRRQQQQQQQSSQREMAQPQKARHAPPGPHPRDQ